MWNSVKAILSPTVLVADDSRDTRLMLKRAFELKGYRVLEAANGREVLNLTSQGCPNLLLIDLNMPELDGLETVKNLRNLEGTCEHLPIVAITAFDVYGMEEAALETGCNEYIRKPFHLDELDRVLKGLGFLV
jgi:CheY-like chemotaxis protein